MAIKTNKGIFLIDTGNNLFIDGKFILNLNKIYSSSNVGSDKAAMAYFSPSDMFYSSFRNSVFIMGSSLDRSHVPEERYSNTRTFIGMNYTVIMEYDFSLKDILFKYSMAGSGVYAADYDTNFYELPDYQWPKQYYDWSKWVIQPKSARTLSDNHRWIMAQIPFDDFQKAEADDLPADDQLIQVYKLDYERMELVHYLYFNGYSFKTLVMEVPEARPKYKDFVFNTAGVLFQSTKNGNVQLINVRDEYGVGYEFDLSKYSQPKFIQLYWK